MGVKDDFDFMGPRGAWAPPISAVKRLTDAVAHSEAEVAAGRPPGIRYVDLPPEERRALLTRREAPCDASSTEPSGAPEGQPKLRFAKLGVPLTEEQREAARATALYQTGDVVVRVNPAFRLAMHIDTDEGNAGNIQTGMLGYIEEIQSRH